MSIIQDNINKMFKEKERQDLLIDSVINRGKNDFDVFLQTQKGSAVLSEKEKEYMDSIYYSEYLKCLNYLEDYADNLYNQMLYIYEFNRINFNDAFFKQINSTINIVGIGFDIPEKFVVQMKDTVKDYLIEKSTIEDGIFEVSILPIEYRRTGTFNSVCKPTYLYQMHVDLKRKVIQNKQKQKSVYK